MKANVELVWTFILDYTKNWGIRRHSHDYLQMCYCLSGSSRFYLDGQILNVGSNDCLLILPNQIHEMYPVASGQFRMIDTKFYICDSELYQAILKMPSLLTIADGNFRDLQQSMRGEWASSLFIQKRWLLFFLNSHYTHIFVCKTQ